MDLARGRVTTSVPTGAGALSVAADYRTGRVVVANRTAGTVSIVDPCRGVTVRTVPVGANPNHVEVARGVAYVLDKSGAGPAGADLVHRIRITR